MNTAGRFRAIQVIHFSLIAMPGVFAAVVYVLISQEASQQAPLLYWFILCGFLLLAAVASQFLYKAFSVKAKSAPTTDQKLSLYSPAVLMRNAPWEGAALLSGALALVSADPLLLLPYPAIALVMFMLRPSPESVREDFGLTLDEMKALTQG